jgi:hypothetical protein
MYSRSTAEGPACSGCKRCGLEQLKEPGGPGNMVFSVALVELGESHRPRIQLNRGVSPRHPSGGGNVSQVHAAGSSSSGNAGHSGSGGAGGGGALHICWHPGNEFEPVPHCGKPPVDGNCGMHGCPVVPTQRVSSVPWACVRVLSRRTIGLLARRCVLGRVAQRIETELSRVWKRAATSAGRSRDVAAVSKRWRRRRRRRLPRALSHQQAAHQCDRAAAPHLRVPRSYSTRLSPPLHNSLDP